MSTRRDCRKSGVFPAGIAGLLLALGMAVAAAGEPGPENAVTFRILAFNDFHGQLTPPATGVRVKDPAGTEVTLSAGGAPYLGGLIDQLRRERPRSIVVAAGDLIGATPLSSAMFHDEPSIEALSAMGLALSAVGNHELDHGLVELKRMQNGGCAPEGGVTTCRRGPFKGAAFRYLAANLLDAGTHQPVFPAYSIQTLAIGGGAEVRIGFIGAVTRSLRGLVKPEALKGLEVSDEADAINAQIPALRAQGIDAIVVLIHEGGSTASRSFDDDSCPGFSGAILPIMDRLDPAVDLVISGHTHNVYLCRHNGRLVTSAGAQGLYLTVIDVTLDRERKAVVNTHARQFATFHRSSARPAPKRPSVPKSPAVEALVDFYGAAARPFVERRIVHIEAPILRRPSPAGESPLGDLVADAQLAGTADPAAGGAQIALVNASGIRGDLRSENGWITHGDLFGIQPFGNRLVTVTLTGEQLLAALEHQWEQEGLMLQVSQGFTYQWDPAAPVGSRVERQSLRLAGVPIDLAASYRVTLNDFLAAGGNGFKSFAAGTERTMGQVDLDALEKYLGSHPPTAVGPPRILRRETAQVP